MRVTPEAEPVSVQTRSRSDKNTAVLGSKEPHQVPVFLYGLYRHRLRLRLAAVKGCFPLTKTYAAGTAPLTAK